MKFTDYLQLMHNFSTSLAYDDLSFPFWLRFTQKRQSDMIQKRFFPNLESIPDFAIQDDYGIYNE